MAILALGATQSLAKEVNKAQIPSEHTAKTCKSLPWGAKEWDLDEAVAGLKKDKNLLWVDTRPGSFFKKGSVRNAVLLPYNKSGKKGNICDKESLESKISAAGLSKDNCRIVFFCQGPKCHRSYNAAYKAVKEWGFAPDKVVWFRDGYPALLKQVKADPKLKRKAKKYISDEGLSQM